MFGAAGQSGFYTIRIYSLDPEAAYYYKEISGYLITGQTNEHAIIQPANHSISLAKSYLGANFELRGKIVSSASDSVAGMYIQEPDRSAGIKIVPDPSDPNLPYEVGDVIDAAGLIELACGELQISNAQINRTLSGFTVTAVGMPNKSIGGMAFGGQPEITGTYGLNNIGLLIRCWGAVSHIGNNYFYIDDGSGLADGSGHKGIRVGAPGLTLPSLDDHVAVTGVSSNTTMNGNTVRMLKMREQSDLRTVQTGYSRGTMRNLMMSVSGFKSWPYPTADEILASDWFISAYNQPGAIGWALSQPDGSVIDLPSVQVAGQRENNHVLWLKEAFEPIQNAPKLVLLLNKPAPDFKGWLTGVDIVGGTLATLPGGQRALVSPQVVYAHTDASGRHYSSFLLPKRTGDSLLPSFPEWPWRVQIAP